LVVERVAALVESAQVLRQRLLEEVAVDHVAPESARGVDNDLDRVEQPARVAVGPADQPLAGAALEGDRRRGVGASRAGFADDAGRARRAAGAGRVLRAVDTGRVRLRVAGRARRATEPERG